MSSRIFQGIIVQMKEATTRSLGVIESNGNIVASTDLGLVGTQISVPNAIGSDNESKFSRYNGRTFKAVNAGGTQYDYAVFVEGEDEYAKTICMLVGVAVSEAKYYYEESHDNSVFIKNIISNNVMPRDIYTRAKELSIPLEATHYVFLIRQFGVADFADIEVVQNLFPDKQNDFVISMSESDIVVVKRINSAAEEKNVNKIAEAIQSELAEKLGIKTVIGIGTPAHHLRELSDRYKEAQVAIDVGRVFENDKVIINYETLGIGRLIYQLPTTLCEMFLSEVFKKNPIDTLDEETLCTINKFFENSLNVSETSRKLYVHRNTLVYRLEKIKKLTGLDLREFDHAIVFKVALMVKQYLDSQETKG